MSICEHQSIRIKNTRVTKPILLHTTSTLTKKQPPVLLSYDHGCNLSKYSDIQFHLLIHCTIVIHTHTSVTAQVFMHCIKTPPPCLFHF